MGTLIGILIVTIILFLIRKISAIRTIALEQLEQQRPLPNVEPEPKEITELKHSPSQTVDRLNVAPNMAANQRKVDKKKRRKQKKYTAAYLKQAIIMKEILDEPRAKRPLRKQRI